MCENITILDLLNRVRDTLKKENVSLWLSPYRDLSGEPSDVHLQELAARLSKNLPGMSPDCCLLALTELQSAAIDNLAIRESFASTSIATFKVKVPHSGLVTVTGHLEDDGNSIIAKLAEKLNLRPERLRLIGKGKLLNGAQKLSAQGVVNNQKFLLIVLEDQSEVLQENDAMHNRIRSVKEDAVLLSAQGNKYMTMEDQHGNAIALPPSEHKGIMLGLMLHKKGKAAMERSHYNEALFLFLEADDEFSKCRSELLASVDNYALLYLDIAWCYLKLRSADYLQDAERRLNSCEQKLNLIYGPALSRVKQIKGSTANEMCLLMRLHLMQAIVIYHQNNREEARSMFDAVQQELNALKVDDSSLKYLVEMGFAEHESRIALREAQGNVSEAITAIYNQRERKRVARANAREVERKAGPIDDEDDEHWVNPKTLTALCDMGYNIDAARVALSQSRNDINQALGILSESSSVGGLSSASSKQLENKHQHDKLMIRILKLKQSLEITGKLFVALKALPPDEVKAFLERVNGATEDKKDGIITSFLDTNNTPSSSSLQNAENNTSYALDLAKRLLEERNVYDRFSEDLTNEEEYLNCPLVDEERLLIEYISVLRGL